MSDFDSNPFADPDFSNPFQVTSQQCCFYHSESVFSFLCFFLHKVSNVTRSIHFDYVYIKLSIIYWHCGKKEAVTCVKMYLLASFVLFVCLHVLLLLLDFWLNSVFIRSKNAFNKLAITFDHHINISLFMALVLCIMLRLWRLQFWVWFLTWALFGIFWALYYICSVF